MRPTLMIAAALPMMLISTSRDALCQEGPETLDAHLPVVPQLSFEQRPSDADDRIFTMAQIAIPEMDDFKCEIWCYEDRFGAGEAEMQDDGSLLLTHTHESVTLKTHLVPEPGAVVFNIEAGGPDPGQVKGVRSVNPCWQLRESEAFGNRGDFYEDFVSRCFIYTLRGLTLMKDTIRFPDTRREKYERHPERNDPPWVQVYAPVWRRHGGQPQAFWGTSTDRPIYSIIGCVSRDGKYLTAFGWPESSALSQGWHDCLHGGPDFSGFYDPEANKVICHGKLYFMRNDPEALLAQYLEDFPQPQPAFAIDAEAATIAHRRLPRAPLGLCSHRLHETTWGTYATGTRVREDGRNYALRQLWFAHGEVVEYVVTVRNDGEAAVSLMLDPLLSTEPTTGYWTNEVREDDLVILNTDLVAAGCRIEAAQMEIPPGEQRSVRGRIRLVPGTPDQLRALLDEDVAEWQRARPYLLSIDGPRDAELEEEER